MECPHLCKSIKINRDFIKIKKLEIFEGNASTTTATVPPAAATATTTTTTTSTPPIICSATVTTKTSNNNTSSSRTSTATTTSSKQWRCSDCSSTINNWMCLNCGIVLCGRYEKGHALAHSDKNSEHIICLNILNQSVYCYNCDDIVVNDTATNLLDQLRHEIKRNPDDLDTCSEASTFLDESVSSKSQQTTETRSTSSSDSGCWGSDEQQPIAGTSSSSSSSLSATVTTTSASGGSIGCVTPGGSRKLRPRKRTNSSDSPESIKRKKLKKVVGLRNLGNTCFMNSVLQSLSNIQEFSCYFNALPSLESIGGGSSGSSSGSGSSSAKQKRVYHSRSLKENNVSGSNSGGGSGGSSSSSSSSSSGSSSSGNSNNANVVEELRKILTNLSHGGDGSKAISPECLFLVIWKVVPQFRGHRQHDAHEFLRYMLDRLHTELQNIVIPPIEQIIGKNNKGTTLGGGGGGGIGSLDSAAGIMFKGRSSIVTSVFGGTLQSEVRCLMCGMESKKHDPFLDLSLDIPEKFYKENDDDNNQPVCHISDCLSSFTEIEELAETELYYCSSCKCKQKSTKRFWIRRLPNVLCLHIKRFRWNNFFRTKIDLRISFPITSMDMSQFVLNNGPETRRSSAGTNVYDLAAVIVHHGNGSSCGHYTSFANNNGTWLHFNDHTVKEVLPSAVAECKPYILFYIRRDLNKPL